MGGAEVFREQFERVQGPEQRLQVFEREFQRIQQSPASEYDRMHATVDLTRAFISTMPVQMNRQQTESVIHVINRALDSIDRFSGDFIAFTDRNIHPSHISPELMALAFDIRHEVQGALGDAREHLENARAYLEGYRDHLDGRQPSRIGLQFGQEITPEERLQRGLSAMLSGVDSIASAQQAATRFDGFLKEQNILIEGEQNFGRFLFGMGIAVSGLAFGEVLTAGLTEGLTGLRLVGAEALIGGTAGAAEATIEGVASGHRPAEILRDAVISFGVGAVLGAGESAPEMLHGLRYTPGVTEAAGRAARLIRRTSIGVELTSPALEYLSGEHER